MKYSILVIAIISVLVLGFGATPAISTALGTAPRTLPVSAQEQPEGARILESSCLVCHELMDPQDYGYTEADWHDLLQRMIGYGAVLGDTEYDTLIRYLVAAGEEEPAAGGAAPTADLAEGARLFESACTTCHDTSGITEYPGSYSEQDYRDLVNNMIAYGAALDAARAELVVEYLTATYGRAGEVPDAEAAATPAAGTLDEEAGAEDAGLAEGARLFESGCTTCHDVSGITEYPGTYDEAGFRDMIRRMLDYGAPLTADEAELVLQYLVATYGR